MKIAQGKYFDVEQINSKEFVLNRYSVGGKDKIYQSVSLAIVMNMFHELESGERLVFDILNNK